MMKLIDWNLRSYGKIKIYSLNILLTVKLISMGLLKMKLKWNVMNYSEWNQFHSYHKKVNITKSKRKLKEWLMNLMLQFLLYMWKEKFILSDLKSKSFNTNRLTNWLWEWGVVSQDLMNIFQTIIKLLRKRY